MPPAYLTFDDAHGPGLVRLDQVAAVEPQPSGVRVTLLSGAQVFAAVPPEEFLALYRAASHPPTVVVPGV